MYHRVLSSCLITICHNNDTISGGEAILLLHQHCLVFQTSHSPQPNIIVLFFSFIDKSTTVNSSHLPSGNTCRFLSFSVGRFSIAIT